MKVVMCLNRWKNICSSKFRNLGSAVLHFYGDVLDGTIMSSSGVLDETNVLSSLRHFARTFSRCGDYCMKQAHGLQSLTSIFKSIPNSAISTDVMGLLLASWKEKIYISENVVRGVAAYCESQSLKMSSQSLRELISTVMTSVSGFCGSLRQGNASNPILIPVSDINLFCFAVNFLNLCISFSPLFLTNINFLSLINDLNCALCGLDNALVEFQSMDEKTSASKRSMARERSTHLRRAATVVVSLFQSVALHLVQNRNFSTDALVGKVVETHSSLMDQIQTSRHLVYKSELLTFPGEGKDQKNSKDGIVQRRRCQELIVSPMQFSRSQEGFIVQGEKLLSNFKGIDFTITCWLFLTKKTSSKSSFIVGKVSHNDAWPLIMYRGNDGKVEVVFGRANEFERLISQSSIPLYSWVHIAVAVEPRKIKLFINGNMDSQVTTAGNARAILYPVIIGSCPQGVRTRVDNIREGFDGLLARLKYYTRALCPIHVRIIFDHGPPEAHDARERWTFQLLASAKVLLDSNISLTCNTDLTGMASSMCRLLLSDSNRLRVGSMKVLTRILSSNTLKDLHLSRQSRSSTRDDSKDENQTITIIKESVMNLPFLAEFSLFQEKVVSFFIHILGACWYPPLAASGNSSDTSDCKISGEVSSLLLYCPSFVGMMDETAATTESVTGTVETPVAREDQVMELGHNIFSMLFELSKCDAWRKAVSNVVHAYLRMTCTTIEIRAEWNQMQAIKMLGVSVLLGEISCRPNLGSDAQCFYLNENGRILSVDNTTGHAVLLASTKKESSTKLITVKVGDLSSPTEKIFKWSLDEKVKLSAFDLLQALYPYAHVILTDLLALYRPDHLLMRQTMMKCVRPFEIFLYHQIVRYVVKCSDITLQDIVSKSFVLKSFLQNSARALPTSGHVGNDESVAENLLPSLWMKSVPFLNTMNNKFSSVQFPPADSEKYFSDYVSKHLGVVAEAFHGHQTKLLKAGLLTELIFSVSSTSSVESSPQDFILFDTYPISDRGLPIANDDNSEQIAAYTLRLVYQLRRSIIHHSRQFFVSSQMTEEIYSGMSFPWKLILWQEIALVRSEAPTGEYDGMISMMSSVLMRSYGHDVTHAIICCIRYAAISFFQSGFSKRTKGLCNVFEATEVFNRFLQSCFAWFSCPRSMNDEIELCVDSLKMLLPSLAFIENPDVELSVLSICSLAHKILNTKIIQGWNPSPEVLELSKSSCFAVLWSRAQENMLKERGQAPTTMSALTRNLASLAAGFVVTQTSSTRNIVGALKPSPSTYSMTPRTPRTLPSPPPSTVCAPRIVACTTTSVEIEVSHSAIEGENALYEIAIRVANDGDDAPFETIYFGACGRIWHNGLTLGVLYGVRYRKFSNGLGGEWSSQIDFRTESGGPPFVFDVYKCGGDIIVSQDGCTASYTGDDNWSTVLGNVPFTTGVNSWEIRISSSSTAYIFVGVATSAVDLNTFLGGCGNGWGFIGEQALYHGREKVKIYGEPFSSGDIVSVTLDFNNGTLSFSKNGKMLGVAFDKLYGELFPAVAFYNAGQEVEIISDSCRSVSQPMGVPCSPAIMNLNDCSLVAEMLYCLINKVGFSSRVLDMIVQHLNMWTSGLVMRKRAVSGSNIYVNKKSALLQQMGYKAGDRIRNQYGIAEIIGVAYNRIWFQTKEREGIWFFSKQQMISGKAKGLFQKCSYAGDDSITEDTCDDNKVLFDVVSVHEMLDPSRWSTEVDGSLVRFMQYEAEMYGCNVWDISSDCVCNDFRTLQQQLSRYVMQSVELSHKWGIAGPKRKAILARIGMLRIFNGLLEGCLPLFLPSMDADMSLIFKKHNEELNPPTTLTCVSEKHCPSVSGASSLNVIRENGIAIWPLIRINSSKTSDGTNDKASSALFSLPIVREFVFSSTKSQHFWKILAASTARVSKTEDDYDYPDDLPQVKLNYFRSYRAKESHDVDHNTLEDLMYASLFCQLWKELRQYPVEKLRISYTHPMDDGQSRAFKVRFEGEGVDDYGGPYREVFQKVCEELQMQDCEKENDDTRTKASKQPKCYLPILVPTQNWVTGDDCEEKYRFVFNSTVSPVKLDMYNFLGQFVGIAIRSKITLDMPLASFIWKCVVRETLTASDVASFDVTSANFISYLISLSDRYKSCGGSLEALGPVKEEAEAVLGDVTWSATLTDGSVVELIPGGASLYVTIADLDRFIQKYVEARLTECFAAVEAFREGILTVIPESALAILCADELEQIVCGSTVIDIKRLKENTEYDDDVSPEDSHIVAFWEVLEEFSEEEKSAFLRFVWARPTLPPKNTPFSQKMKIQSAVGDDLGAKPDTYLPKAHTCFFSINLPHYSSKEVMAEKLKYAIFNCTEMDADFRVTEQDVAGWTPTPAPRHVGRVDSAAIE